MFRLFIPVLRARHASFLMSTCRAMFVFLCTFLVLTFLSIDFCKSLSLKHSHGLGHPNTGAVALGGSADNLVELDPPTNAPETSVYVDQGKLGDFPDMNTEEPPTKSRYPKPLRAVARLFASRWLASRKRKRRLALQICYWYLRGRHKRVTPSKLLIFLPDANADGVGSRKKMPRGGCCTMPRFRRKGSEMLADTDPSLSQKDIQTAFRVNEAFRELFEHIHKCEGRVKRRQPASFCIDAFVTSPLTVSLQTASISTVAMGKEMACKDPKQTLEEKSRVTWLIDPMLREQLSGPSETGTELNELLTRLNELYDNVQMARTAIDIATMAAGETWWSPYTKDELETILHRNRLVAPGQILADEDSATGEEAAAAEETEAGEAASAAADADQSTVVKIGDPEVMPLTASARALRDTIKTVERPLHNRNDEGASAERPVRESDDLVELRGKVILHVLCKTEALTTVLLVSHKKLLEKMLRKRISPAKLKFAILSCGVEPSLAVLSSKTPVSSIQQSLGDLSQLPAQEE